MLCVVEFTPKVTIVWAPRSGMTQNVVMAPHIRAIAAQLPDWHWSTGELLAKAGDRLSPKLVAMLSKLGVNKRHSTLSNYPDVLFAEADPDVGVSGTDLAVQASYRCLAKAGVSPGPIGLYESAPDLNWGGYLLHLNADGGGALRRCLPEHLYRLYVATSRRSPRRDLVVVLDHHGAEVTTIPHIGPPNDPVTPHTSVHRRTLCQILLNGVTGIVHFGREVTGYRHDGTSVALEFADGGQARGTLVVGADGINSVVRRQLLPHTEVVPLVEHALLALPGHHHPANDSYASPAGDWPPGNVTLLGDAVHAMPPMYGHGANSALYDAAELVTALADKGSPRHEVARYEAGMRARTFPLLERALAHVRG